MKQQKDKLVRRPYEKPEIRIVELKPEEALVAACKTMSLGSCGPDNCLVGNCFATTGS